MKLKKLTALLLAAVMLLALCACGRSTVIEAYTDDDLPVATPAAEASEEEPEAEALDFNAAYAAYTPETVVFYVNGDPVTWQELFYEIVYYTNYLLEQEGTTLTSWDQDCTLVTDADGNYYSYGVVVLQNAVSMLVQYHTMYNKLNELGITAGEEAQEYVETQRQNAIDTYFDGDEDAFEDYLTSMFCTDELWNWFNQVDAMYSFDGFDTLYGEFGCDYSDEDTLTYAQGAEDGTWTQYVQLKQIYLYTDDASDESASGEASSAEPAVTAEEIAQEINDSWDKDGTFDELYAEYNENSDLDPYTDGWCVYQGDTDDAIYQAALEMETDEAKVVSIDGADVVVLKVDVEPDAGVYYDAANDIMYTLRYYAAWQDYSDLINGEDGWLATAETEWATGFENFTLDSVF